MNELTPVFVGPDRAVSSFTRPTPNTGGLAESSVSMYLRIARRWRWLIAGAVAVALIIGLVVTLLATRQYSAETRIEVNREGSRIVNVEGVQPETSAVDQEFYQTQYGVLSSTTMAERVVRKLRLADDQAFFRTFKSTDALASFEGGRAASSPASRNLRFKTAVGLLSKNVDIVPIRLSRLIDIRWTSPSPTLSARVANTWATEFIQYNLDRRFDQTAYARRFLEQRLGQLRNRLEDSERQVVGYASQQSIINIPSGSDEKGVSQERSLTADSLTALNNELARATADRIRAESRKSGSDGSSTEALTNSTIATLRQRRAEVAAEYARLLTQFEPGYPAAAALAAQLRTLDSSIRNEEGRVSGSFTSGYQEALAREQALNQRMEQLKANFVDERRRGIQYNTFQRDADTNRELYNGLLQRYKEIGVAGGVGNNNVAIVDPAEIPVAPSSPRPLINMLVALLAGLLIGVLLAFIREQIDETIVDPADVERRVGLPLLGVIPRVDDGNVLAGLRDPKSSVLEAYLSVQTALSFSTDHGVPRVISVTSTRPGEGKSTTSLAIAYSMARSGRRTILIDGDMRSPSVHGDLAVSNDRGLSNYLAGTDDIANLIQTPDIELFAVMAAGPTPPNAAELLRSDRLDDLIVELLRSFDHIVIDSPPVLGLADAPLIASRTEATLFVVEARGVKARIARQALARLQQGRSNLLGTILTKFEAKRAHYGYGYDYGYGYGGDKKNRRSWTDARPAE